MFILGKIFIKHSQRFFYYTSTSLSTSLGSSSEHKSLPEGFVNWPVPADKRHRGEEDEPQDGQTEVHTFSSVSGEVSQASQDVEEQGGAMDCDE